MPRNYAAIPVGQNDIGRRIDRIVRKACPEMSLGQVYGAIRSGAIRVDDRKTKPDHRLENGEILSARPDLPLSRLAKPLAKSLADAPDNKHSIDEPASVGPDLLDEQIAFQSEHIVVVAKARGELVHGPGSLEQGIRSRLANQEDGVSFRPGPVHRLDRNTSGLVVYAASLHGAHRMTEAIQTGGLTKRYAAVIHGRLDRRAVWDNRLRRNEQSRTTVADPHGLTSETRVEPIAMGNGMTFVEIELVTGRTHQIRAHAQINRHPIVGDRKYGGASTRGGYILHAGFLELSAQFSDIGFRRLWRRLPPEPSSRVAALFGEDALTRLYQRWDR